MVEATESESARRREVLGEILGCIRSNRRVRLPDWQGETASSDFLPAPLRMGLEPNPFGGRLGEFRYQFEGEDDLLHLMVARLDNGEFSLEEARKVAAFLLEGVASALIWVKPGHMSHHFYVGHDELLTGLKI